MWVFLIWEPVRLLGACKPGSWARMDSRTGQCKQGKIVKGVEREVFETTKYDIYWCIVYTILQGCISCGILVSGI